MINNFFFFPLNFSIKILKKTNYILLLENQITQICLNIGKFIRVNKYTNTLMVRNNRFKILNKINDFFKSYSVLNLDVIKFKGKGYKLSKKKNTIDFLFNFSHINYYISKKSLIIKPHKSKFLLLNYDDNNLQQIKKKIVDIRRIDKYTYNGLRLKRQMVYKRKGKTLSN